jgi:hypothetical protein
MSRLRAITLLSSALFCLSLPAADPPKVAVQFVIEAPRYRTDLGNRGGPAALSQVEQEVAAAVAAELRARFPYLQWTSGEATRSALKARLVGRPAGGQTEFRVVLQGLVNGTELGSPPEPLLFFWYDTPVTEEPSLVIRELTAKLKTVLADSTVQSQLKAHFTSNVPLIDSVTVRPQERQVIVPLNPAKMQAAENSLLEVRFVAAGKNGRMMLSPSILTDTDIGCRVVRIAYPPIDEAGFHPNMPTALSSVSVTMSEYFYRAYAGTSGTRVTTP